MKKTTWGQTPDGTPVSVYTLASDQIEVRLTSYGAHLVSVLAPDRAGTMADVALGFDELAGYLQPHNGSIGSTVGRYANRIAKGQFSIDGNHYQIPLNNGPNALHGGPVGFEYYVWHAQEERDAIEFTHVSPDGDMGFPGTLTAKVRYSLSGNVLRLDYTATTDKPTVLNLTNHAYFNLRGNDQGDILDHVVQLNADHYLPCDATQIPTGQIAPVDGTPFDFRNPHSIRARIDNGSEQLRLAGGYDQSYVAKGQAGTLRPAATVTEPTSGRTLSVETTEPAVHLYTGNSLNGTLVGRHGTKYERRTGFCLETQHFPDSPNHANFPSTVLRPGETWKSTTTFTFDVS